MKNKILLVIVIILAVVYIFIRSSNKDTSFLVKDNKVKIKDVKTGRIESLDMEEYLVGVVAGEMPASFENEALKAQAIAARTYAYYKVLNSTSSYDLTSDKSTQVYITKDDMQKKWNSEYQYYYQKIKTAINDTKDLILVNENEVISAYYFAMSNGYTENAITVFGEDKEYLISVISKEEENNRKFKVNKTINKTDFCNILEIDCSNIIISQEIRNETNRVSSININNKKFTGIEIRKKLDLRSTDFIINVKESTVEIETKGYGHGVGMSQYGANTMAKEGATYQEILNHYYSDVKIENVNSII